MKSNFPIGICSYSFVRMLNAGKQDIYSFITDCAGLGCSQLDPWNGHLKPLRQRDALLAKGEQTDVSLTPDEVAYVDSIRAAGDKAGLPFGCIAVDGTCVYHEDAEQDKRNRPLAYRWIEICGRLGASQMRIDAGGPEDLPDHAFEKIVAGYNDLIARAGEVGVEIVTENHWGPTKEPVNCVKILDAIDGLGFLFDSNNWAPGRQDDGFRLCAKYATGCHIKVTTDPKVLPQATEEAARRGIRALIETGYDGCWGIESHAHSNDIDEIAHARSVIELIGEELAAAKV